MSKLIDASDLKNIIHEKSFNSEMMNPIFTYAEIMNMIDVSSTVNAIPIPEGATNGDVVNAIFPDVIISESEDTVHLKYHTVNSDPLFFVQVSKRWWNAPYKESEE